MPFPKVASPVIFEANVGYCNPCFSLFPIVFHGTYILQKAIAVNHKVMFVEIMSIGLRFCHDSFPTLGLYLSSSNS